MGAPFLLLASRSLAGAAPLRRVRPPLSTGHSNVGLVASDRQQVGRRQVRKQAWCVYLLKARAAVRSATSSARESGDNIAQACLLLANALLLQRELGVFTCTVGVA